jgi:uncharacterized membrane protein
MAEHATTVTRTQYEHVLERHTSGQFQANVGDVERLFSLIGGGALAMYGLRRSLGHLALIAAGGALIYRGLTGRCAVYETFGLSTASQDSGPGITLAATVTVNKPAADVYRFWRRFENHPRFVSHLESVVSTDNKRSHWVAKGPMQRPIAWDAEIVEEQENALLSWRSLPGADLDNAGTVRFQELPNGRGTEVRLQINYSPPGGIAGAALARLFKTPSERQLKEDLRRFKQIIEAGEMSSVADQPSGRSVSS